MDLHYANITKVFLDTEQTQKLSCLSVRQFFMLLLSSADIFKKKYFSKNSFRNTTRVSNGLDPDQDQIDPDLGPNCFVWFGCLHSSQQLWSCWDSQFT